MFDGISNSFIFKELADPIWSNPGELQDFNSNQTKWYIPGSGLGGAAAVNIIMDARLL